MIFFNGWFGVTPILGNPQYWVKVSCCAQSEELTSTLRSEKTTHRQGNCEHVSHHEGWEENNNGNDCGGDGHGDGDGDGDDDDDDDDSTIYSTKHDLCGSLDLFFSAILGDDHFQGERSTRSQMGWNGPENFSFGAANRTIHFHMFQSCFWLLHHG